MRAAGEVDVVVPAGGVEDLALEFGDAVDVGQPGLGQATRSDEQGAGGDGPPQPPQQSAYQAANYHLLLVSLAVNSLPNSY